jgi:hypothetical protein
MKLILIYFDGFHVALPILRIIVASEECVRLAETSLFRSNHHFHFVPRVFADIDHAVVEDQILAFDAF